MYKRILATALALSMVLGLTSCGKQNEGPEFSAPLSESPQSPRENQSREDFVFTDSCGRDVTIPGSVTRIVPSSSLAQIVLYAIAPDMLVGVADKWNNSARDILPAEFFDLPYLGRLYGSADLNIESLALAAPQLMIDIGEVKGSIKEDLDTLQEQTQIPSLFIASSLKDMPEIFRTLGMVLGRKEKGEELAVFCENVYNRTVHIMDEVGEENKVRSLYVLGENGLNVLAKGSYHAELINLLTNNLADVENPISKGSGNEVTMEQISLWNPDFVVFAPDSIYDSVGGLSPWNQITAIKNGNYVESPNVPYNWMGMPPSVQRYLGMIWLTGVLYPDYCDYNVEEEVREYYELFYHLTLTDDLYEHLTENAFPDEL